MSQKFSEFSYGFAVVYECIEKTRNMHFKAAPLFPSLIDEGKKYGYDVKIDFLCPIFLQFKLSEYLKGKNAKEFKDKKINYLPYYRFKIENCNQLHLLKELRKKEDRVFYTAPAFSKIDELNKYFTQRKTLENSVFVDVGEFLNGITKYRIVYRDSSKFEILPWSKYGPIKSKIPCLDANILSKCKKKESINSLVEYLYEEVKNILEESVGRESEYRNLYEWFYKRKNEYGHIEHEIKFLHYTFNVIFDVEPLLIYRTEEAHQ